MSRTRQPRPRPHRAKERGHRRDRHRSGVTPASAGCRRRPRAVLRPAPPAAAAGRAGRSRSRRRGRASWRGAGPPEPAVLREEGEFAVVVVAPVGALLDGAGDQSAADVRHPVGEPDGICNGGRGHCYSGCLNVGRSSTHARPGAGRGTRIREEPEGRAARTAGCRPGGERTAADITEMAARGCTAPEPERSDAGRPGGEVRHLPGSGKGSKPVRPGGDDRRRWKRARGRRGGAA